MLWIHYFDFFVVPLVPPPLFRHSFTYVYQFIIFYCCRIHLIYVASDSFPYFVGVLCATVIVRMPIASWLRASGLPSKGTPSSFPLVWWMKGKAKGRLLFGSSRRKQARSHQRGRGPGTTRPDPPDTPDTAERLCRQTPDALSSVNPLPRSWQRMYEDGDSLCRLRRSG